MRENKNNFYHWVKTKHSSKFQGPDNSIKVDIFNNYFSEIGEQLNSQFDSTENIAAQEETEKILDKSIFLLPADAFEIFNILRMSKDTNCVRN